MLKGSYIKISILGFFYHSPLVIVAIETKYDANKDARIRLYGQN